MKGHVKGREDRGRDMKVGQKPQEGKGKEVKKLEGKGKEKKGDKEKEERERGIQGRQGKEGRGEEWWKKFFS